MSLVFIQYPPVILLLLAAALLTLAAGRVKRYIFLTSLLAGIAAIAMLLWGLYCAVPLTELLGLLLLLVLLGGCAFRKGGRS